MLEFEDEKSPSLSFLTPDGETEGDINGTWRGPCLNQDPDSTQYLLDFLHKDFVLVTLAWSGETACSGSPSTVTQYEGTLTVGSGREVGWNPAAPDTLPDPVLASGYTHKLKEAADFGDGDVSTLRGVGLIVTTAAPEVLYIGGSFDTGLTLDDDGYPTQLQADAYYRD